ncbi:MAG TPA: PAS domain S-box protein [Terriglobales bacterium]|nr:PAS domain S-box protein [Terriglobales bacterium]
MAGEESASHANRRWPAVSSVILCLGISFAAWFAARNAEHKHIRRMTGLAARGIREDLGADTNLWVLDLARLATLWDSADGPTQAEWKSNAELYILHHPGCLAVEWMQPTYGERGLVRAPGISGQSLSLSQMRAHLLQEASATSQPFLSGAVRASDGEEREVIAVPVIRDQQLEGLVIALIDVRRSFETMMSDVLPLGYSIAVRESGTEIFRLKSNTPQNEWAESDQLSLPGVAWELSVWPKPAVLSEMTSRFPEAMLLASALVGGLLTLAVYLVRESAAKSGRLQQANQKLTATVEEVRRTETALRASQARLAAILENSADGVVCVNQHLQITLFNQAAENMFGYKEEEVVGQHLDILVPERLRAIHHQHIARFDASSQHALKMSNRKPVLGLRKDGTEFPMDAPLTRIEIDGEKVFTLTMRDITGRLRAEEELLRSRNELEVRVRERTAELQELSNKMAELQDEDRRRIARELHDGTTQMLIALNVDLGMIGASDAALQQKLTNPRVLVKQCLDELRTVSYLLHPPLLDEIGLELALRNYVKGVCTRSDLDVALQLPPNLNQLPRGVQVAIFRIVQEALANIHRHSDSRSASILLAQEADELRMEIADQGRGIPPEVLHNTDGRAGIGIASMRERVRQLGGRFDIECNAGTTIRVTLPTSNVDSLAESAETQQSKVGRS